MSGMDPPIPMGTVSGMFNDSILFADNAIEVSITGSKQGGAAYLDNFHYDGEKSADSCNRTTGIEDIHSAEEITSSVANNILTVTSKRDFANAQMEIINVTGQKFLSGNLTEGNSHFNISAFENGIYFLVVTSSRKHFLEKFVLIK
jgi:hypothetical protein